MSDAAKQMMDEIRKLITRYSSESDVTVGEIVMALECQKFNVLMSEERYLEKKNREENE